MFGDLCLLSSQLSCFYQKEEALNSPCLSLSLPHSATVMGNFDLSCICLRILFFLFDLRPQELLLNADEALDKTLASFFSFSFFFLICFRKLDICLTLNQEPLRSFKTISHSCSGHFCACLTR